MAPAPRDLVAVVADLSMKLTLEAVLRRYQSLGIRPPAVESSDVVIASNYDSSVFRDCGEFLRPINGRYSHALVMCDRMGCGREDLTRIELEKLMEVRLNLVGWQGKCAAIVIDPELEVWAWAESPHVEDILGWKGRKPALRQWLTKSGLLPANSPKPPEPKVAMDRALQMTGKRRSSSLFSQLALKVSLQRCTDPAFLKLRSVLQNWFPSG